MQLRVARHTQRLKEVVAFYRDGLGLPEVGGFKDHDGYTGVFLALPGTDVHLELTSGGAHGAPTPHPESLLVLYIGDERAMREIAVRLRVAPVPPANPYWAQHGHTFEDPDGFRVVLVPDRWQESAAPTALRVVRHHGPRSPLRPLFELAEDSARALDAYFHEGRVLVALDGDDIIGYVQVTATGTRREAEIKSLAVDPTRQRRGVGRVLVEAAIALARTEDRSRVVVGTAAADVGNLRFYQRLAFRMRSVERDAFTEARGYAHGLTIGGVVLRDRVWLARDLD
jgi:ribosomal protein S18 acetylase RimI-like enzyme